MSIALLIAGLILTAPSPDRPSPALPALLPLDPPTVETLHRDEGGAILRLGHPGGWQLIRIDAATLEGTVLFTSGTWTIPTRRISFRTTVIDGILVEDDRLFVHSWGGRSFDRSPHLPRHYGPTPSDDRGGGTWCLDVFRISDGARRARVETVATETWLEEHARTNPRWLRAGERAGRMRPVEGGVSLLGSKYILPRAGAAPGRSSGSGHRPPADERDDPRR